MARVHGKSIYHVYGEIKVNKDPYQIILRPVITEKSTVLKETNREICFEVNPRANKIEIRQAVEQLFKTKVESVRVMNKSGKKRRVGRNVGRKKNWKKAYVKLKEGEKMIEYFEAV
ncbi:MAG: 50S ribosomal protein L23 [Acidobacteria bacterium]|nr:50S ribosomal protein L23 [Acidobacteriota bacterium]MBU1339835.1 50S ribosomal protein L23 [Acidobacteriota bacterium]MBU1474251.1 50S ribosomal protein L23 [Acidobacteriota bacterium]MBU2437607.1 50S ribosomal protein L23 [Acidobacteriota bacterium]MBU4203827.1 50S ribosomal protein L23 [Acidobacteriota bacterium]